MMLTDSPNYKIVDFCGEIIQGSFYDRELQNVIKIDDV